MRAGEIAPCFGFPVDDDAAAQEEVMILIGEGCGVNFL